jgi:hypothetical protein
MNFRKSHPKSDMAVLLEHGRVIPPIPSSVRARSLERARSTEAGAFAEPAEVLPVARRRAMAITLAASVAFVVGAAGAALALRGRAHNEPRVTLPPSPHQEVASCSTPSALPPASQVAPQPIVETKTARPEPSLTARESYTAELSLLQRAQAAYTDRNFATTLLLVSEHARRFPNGRLAEEREALHVKALIGAGREVEARKAASAFAARFPRSALLPRLGHDSSSGN